MYFAVSLRSASILLSFQRLVAELLGLCIYILDALWRSVVSIDISSKLSTPWETGSIAIWAEGLADYSVYLGLLILLDCLVYADHSCLIKTATNHRHWFATGLRHRLLGLECWLWPRLSDELTQLTRAICWAFLLSLSPHRLDFFSLSLRGYRRERLLRVRHVLSHRAQEGFSQFRLLWVFGRVDFEYCALAASLPYNVVILELYTRVGIELISACRGLFVRFCLHLIT